MDTVASSPASALQHELDQCKRELAFTREQLVKAWLGNRAPLEDPSSENDVDPMQLVIVEGDDGEEETFEDS